MLKGISFKITEEENRKIEDYSWLKRQKKSDTFRQAIVEFCDTHKEEIKIEVKNRLQSE